MTTEYRESKVRIETPIGTFEAKHTPKQESVAKKAIERGYPLKDVKMLLDGPKRRRIWL